MLDKIRISKDYARVPPSIHWEKYPLRERIAVQNLAPARRAPLNLGCYEPISISVSDLLAVSACNQPAEPFSAHMNVIDIFLFLHLCPARIERAVDLDSMLLGECTKVRLAFGDWIRLMGFFVKRPHAIKRRRKRGDENEFDLDPCFFELTHE